MKKLTDKQTKLVLTQMVFKMLMERNVIYDYKNRSSLTNEDVVFLNSFFDKNNLVEIFSDEPRLSSVLLKCKSDYFNADQKVKLIRNIAKDRNLFIDFINDNYFRKTLRVQSEIVSLIGEDSELIVIFAKSLMRNADVEDVKEYINKLKINKKQKEFVNTALVAAKLMN